MDKFINNKNNLYVIFLLLVDYNLMNIYALYTCLVVFNTLDVR
jgi:hypothetical protein